jgi:large subunit ribosomal protein L35
MPKMKRHKGIAKRFRVSAGGKLRYNKSYAGHLMSGKPGKRRRKLRQNVCLDNPALVARMLTRLLP